VTQKKGSQVRRFSHGKWKRGGLVSVAVVVGIGTFAGCATRMTGEGRLPSATDPNRNAMFAFEYAMTDPATGSGRLTGTYHDGQVRVRFDGATSSVAVTSGPQCIDTTAGYVSQNHDSRGEGSLTLFACDNSSLDQKDIFAIMVNTGPFAGYQDVGQTTRSHLTVHSG
jgi:hypothetical protein